MPNHIAGKLVLTGDDNIIDEMLKDIKIDEASFDIGSLDCNKIIPMPDSLNMEDGTFTDRSINAYLCAINPNAIKFPQHEKLTEYEFQSLCKYVFDYYIKFHRLCTVNAQCNAWLMELKDAERDMLIENGKRYVDNIVKYGFPTWYEWKCMYWGSKWGCYNFKPYKDHTMRFQSANGDVSPVIKELSRKYPTIKFDYKWADEDYGRNAGNVVLLDGKEIFKRCASDWSEYAYELVRDCWDLTMEEWRKLQKEIEEES